jgi:hypothetical protein
VFSFVGHLRAVIASALWTRINLNPQCQNIKLHPISSSSEMANQHADSTCQECRLNMPTQQLSMMTQHAEANNEANSEILPFLFYFGTLALPTDKRQIPCIMVLGTRATSRRFPSALAMRCRAIQDTVLVRKRSRFPQRPALTRRLPSPFAIHARRSLCWS